MAEIRCDGVAEILLTSSLLVSGRRLRVMSGHGRWSQRPGRGFAFHRQGGLAQAPPSPAPKLVLGECAQGCRRAARAPALPELKFMAQELAQSEQGVSSHASNTAVKQPHSSWIKHFKMAWVCWHFFTSCLM